MTSSQSQAGAQERKESFSRFPPFPHVLVKCFESKYRIGPKYLDVVRTRTHKSSLLLPTPSPNICQINRRESLDLHTEKTTRTHTYISHAAIHHRATRPYTRRDGRISTPYPASCRCCCNRQSRTFFYRDKKQQLPSKPQKEETPIQDVMGASRLVLLHGAADDDDEDSMDRTIPFRRGTFPRSYLHNVVRGHVVYLAIFKRLLTAAACLVSLATPEFEIIPLSS